MKESDEKTILVEMVTCDECGQSGRAIRFTSHINAGEHYYTDVCKNCLDRYSDALTYQVTESFLAILGFEPLSKKNNAIQIKRFGGGVIEFDLEDRTLYIHSGLGDAGSYALRLEEPTPDTVTKIVNAVEYAN